MKVLDLFSGIGGFSIGLEKAGFKTIAFVEIDTFCQKVLKKNWDIPIYNDIKRICRWKWADSKAQKSLRQVFRARIFHSLEKVPDYPGSVQVSGGRYADAFAWYDHSSRCWRTWQSCLIEGWARYSGAWPESGMTRSGIAYQLPPLVPVIDEKDYSYWPTPTASDCKGAVSLAKANQRKSQSSRGVRLPEHLTVEYQVNIGSRLNPNILEWMQGFPINHTELNQ